MLSVRTLSPSLSHLCLVSIPQVQRQISHVLFSPEEKASQVQSVTKELPEEQRREPVEENI